MNTTFGGILLGEMTHRLSRNILGRGARNKNSRMSSELAAMFANPVNALNRWMDGNWGKADDYSLADSLGRSEFRCETF